MTVLLPRRLIQCDECLGLGIKQRLRFNRWTRQVELVKVDLSELLKKMQN